MTCFLSMILSVINAYHAALCSRWMTSDYWIVKRREVVKKKELRITYFNYASVSTLKLSALNVCQVGEDVPDARKCACASHVATIAEFFQVSLTQSTVNTSSSFRNWFKIQNVMFRMLHKTFCTHRFWISFKFHHPRKSSSSQETMNSKRWS